MAYANQPYNKDASFAPRGGSPVTLGEAGFWLDASGDVAATDNQGNPQISPGRLANPEAEIYYDADTDLYYNMVDGQKKFQSPYGYNQSKSGPTGTGQGTGRGTTAPDGGLLRGAGQWNSKTGKFDQHLAGGNILSMLAGAGMGASYAIPAMMASSAGAAAAPAATSGLLPSTAVGTGMSGPIVGGAGASGLSTGATIAGSGAAGMIPATTGGGGIVNRLMNGLMGGSQPGGNTADLASIFGQSATDAQGNRLMQGNFAQQYDRNALLAQQDRDRTESDAVKKLAQTNYLLSGGSQFKPPTITLGGQQRTAPDLGYGPQPVSDAQKTGAATLQEQLMKRLAPGGTYTPQPLDTYAKAGTAERLAGYADTGLGGLGAILNLFNSGLPVARRVLPNVPNIPQVIGSMLPGQRRVEPGPAPGFGLGDFLPGGNNA